jgi:putative ABC transport system permease protein
MLRVAPSRLRQRHGADMEALFIERLAEARRQSHWSMTSVWLLAAADLLRARVRAVAASRTRIPHSSERRPSMFGTDLKYTFRWLVRQKASTALVASMLALGIGANVVVFSLVNALFLRPFPFPSPERLVYINETAPKWNLEIVGVNFPDFHQWKPNVQMFEAIAIYNTISFNLAEGSNAERIDGANVTADFARVLGVQPIIGRMFSDEEDKPKAPPVAVIGEGLWRERFGGREDVLGKTMKLNGVAHTIVGVMPRAAEFPGRVRLWVPFAGDPNQQNTTYGAEGIGRLKPGVTADAATRDLLRTQEPIWQARDKEQVVSPFARDLREQFSQNFRTAAGALLVAVTLLLVVTCANVASIMLARALVRRREMAIRLAVGASRPRIARQLFLENLVLAAVGGAVGLVLGRWALQLLITAAGDQIPPWAAFDFDARIAAFAVAVTAITALLFGLAPAFHAMRNSVRGTMTETATGTTTGPGGRRTLSALVAAEFALATVLLICGGLLFRAYDRVRHVDPGFNPGNVVTFSIALPAAAYPKTPQQLAFWQRVEARIAALPGVEASGLVSCPPLGCHLGTFWEIEGRKPAAPGEANPVTLFRIATPGYFETMGIRLKSGRSFDDTDTEKSGQVAIVNTTFVKTFWGEGTDPIGRRLRPNGCSECQWMRVVGVAEDVRHYGLEKPMRPGMYMPVAQYPLETLAVAIRTTGDPAAFVPTARAAIRELDPELPLYQVRTMEEALGRSLAQRTLYSWLLGVFAAMALVMALGGTYGVTSYLVSQRTREIGIRVALGARTLDIARNVLRGSLGVVALGLIGGIAGALPVARSLEGLLFGVVPHDARVLLAATAILVTTAVLANWLPARRASRVDPVRSLRAE